MRATRRPPLTAADIFRLVFLLALFAAVLAVGISTDVFEKITPASVHGWVRRAGVWAPAVYVGAFLIRPLTLLPLTLWLIAGGIAFGWARGAAYAFVGVNAGAAVAFFAARGLGRDVVRRVLRRRRGGPGGRARIWSARLVLSLQLFPFMPHDLLNAAAGVSTMPYWRFLLGSALGTLPFVVLYTYAGSVLVAPGSRQFYAAFAALAALSLGSLVASRRLRRRSSQEPVRSAADLRESWEGTRPEPAEDAPAVSGPTGRAREADPDLP